MAVTIAVAAQGRAIADWAQFRGPTQQGIADTSNPPKTWSPTENITWRTELEGAGWSSPVIADGRIFFTSSESSENSNRQSLRALAFDLETGDELWNVEVFEFDDSAPNIHSKNTHASPTPVVDGDALYLHFGHLGSARLTVDGETTWKTQEFAYNPVHGSGASPVLSQGKFIVTCDAGDDPFVLALDKNTGELAWKWERSADSRKPFSFCTPLVLEVDGQPQIIAPGSDVVDALNPATGQPIWSATYRGYSVVPRPVYSEGLLFMSTGFDRASLLAIDPTGTGDVTTSHLRWKTSRNVSKTPSFIATNGLLFTLSDNGILSAYDAKTGEPHFDERLGGAYSSSLLLANGNLYATSEEGVTHVVPATQEYSVLASNDLGERTLASIAVDGDAFILRTEQALYRIEN